MINLNGKQKGSSLQREFFVQEEILPGKISLFHIKEINIMVSGMTTPYHLTYV